MTGRSSSEVLQSSVMRDEAACDEQRRRLLEKPRVAHTSSPSLRSGERPACEHWQAHRFPIPVRPIERSGERPVVALLTEEARTVRDLRA
jgi:hypothetical protein